MSAHAITTPTPSELEAGSGVDSNITTHTAKEDAKESESDWVSHDSQTPAFTSAPAGVQQVDSTHRHKNDNGVHSWYGDDDLDHPTKWPRGKKLWTTFMLALVTSTISVNSAIFSPVAKPAAQALGVSYEVAILGTSLYLLGFGFGPPFWGPISEKFGRKRPMLVGSGGAAIFTLMSGFGKNAATILLGRFLAGVCGSSPATVVPGAATDNWGAVGRGINLAIAVGSIFAGPPLGAIIGGFIVQTINWRWAMWVMTIFGGSVTIFAALFLPETYPPVLLKRRAKRLRASTGDQSILAALDMEKTNFSVILTVYLLRPWGLFVTEPILVLVTIYQAFVYGILYLFLSAYAYAFGTDRGWAVGESELPLLSVDLGNFIAILLTVWYVKSYFAPRIAAANGKVVPEDRLPLMIFGSLIFPIGLFWFAWTAGNPNIHFMVPTIAGVVTGCGMFATFIQCITYLVEVYLPVANSAMASNGMVRSCFGFAFPMFAEIMYKRLGVGWATTMLGFIAVVMIPIPVVFYIYGARIRSWSKNAVKTNAPIRGEKS